MTIRRWWESVPSWVKIAAAVATWTAGTFSAGVGATTVGTGIFRAPIVIDSLGAEIEANRVLIADAERERAEVIRQLGALVCELRTERLGEVPDDCDTRLLR